MKIKVFQTGYISTNTYVTYNEESRKAFVVDPAGDMDKIVGFLRDENLSLEAVLATHGHFDHIGGVAELQQYGAKVYMSKLDEDKILHQNIPGFESYGIDIKPFVPDVLLEGGEELELAGYPVRVIATPGHSIGGLSYQCGNLIFVGDTIFFHSYGRVDFDDSNFEDICISVKKLLAIDGDNILLVGHGQPTSSKEERENNPILYV